MRILLVVIALACVCCLSGVFYLLFWGEKKQREPAPSKALVVPSKPKVLTKSGLPPYMPLRTGFQWVYRVKTKMALSRAASNEQTPIERETLAGALVQGQLPEDPNVYFITHRVGQVKDKVYSVHTYINGRKQKYGDFFVFFDGAYTWEYHSMPKFANLMLPAEVTKKMNWKTGKVTVSVEDIADEITIAGLGKRPCIRVRYALTRKRKKDTITTRWYCRGVGLVKVKGGPGISSFFGDEDWELVSFTMNGRKGEVPLVVKELPVTK